MQSCYGSMGVYNLCSSSSSFETITSFVLRSCALLVRWLAGHCSLHWMDLAIGKSIIDPLSVTYTVTNGCGVSICVCTW